MFTLYARSKRVLVSTRRQGPFYFDFERRLDGGEFGKWIAEAMLVFPVDIVDFLGPSLLQKQPLHYACVSTYLVPLFGSAL